MASRAEARSERVAQAAGVLETALGVPQPDAASFLTGEAWSTFSSFARPGGVSKFFVYYQARETDVRTGARQCCGGPKRRPNGC